MNKKALILTLLLVLLLVALSGCTDLYNALKEYVPTITPTHSPVIVIGENVPPSVVKGVTITGEGHTLKISGRGPYNVNTHQEYITLNQGNATVSIKLKDQGFVCLISMDYTNPITGNTEYMMLHQFSIEDRPYEVTRRIYVPYTAKYCLMVDWGGQWEVSITQ